MEHITHPIRLKETSSKVKTLQDAMVALGYPIAETEHKAGNAGASTLKQVRAFQKKLQIVFDKAVLVDAPTARAMNEALDALAGAGESYSVSGKVVGADGLPVVGLKVVAYDRDLNPNNLQKLGEAVTQADGAYRITYTTKDFMRPEKGKADVFIKVLGAGETVIAESDIRFNARESEVINLTLTAEEYRRESEYNRLNADVLISLKTAKMVKEDLLPEHLDFLSGDLEFNRQYLDFWKQAQELESKTQLAAAYFYGWFREGLPTERQLLFQHTYSALKDALSRANGKNVISFSTNEPTTQELQQIKQLIIAYATTPPAEGEKPSLGYLLQKAGLDGSLLTKTVEHLADFTGTLGGFLEQIAKDPDLGKQEALDEIRFIVSAAAIAPERLPLVKEMNRERKLRNWTSLKEFAVLEVDDWKGILKRAAEDGAHADAQEDTDKRAADIEHQFSKLFPTQSLRARLMKTSSHLGDMPHFVNRFRHLGVAAIANDDSLTPIEKRAQLDEKKKLLEDFFDQNSDFDLRKVDFTRKDSENNTLFWGNIPEAEQKPLRKQLMAYQRVLSLAPTMPDALKLMDLGLDSASAIRRLSLKTFQERTGMTTTKAMFAYEGAGKKASLARDVAHGLVDAARTSDLPKSLMGYRPEIINALRDLGVFDELIGARAYCKCADCVSVLSPAAYFVDLMKFVERHITGANPFAPTSMHLKKRRKDLWELELTCENTFIPVSYLEVLNHVLETSIKGDGPLTAWEILAEANKSIRQPFILAEAQIRLYLSHFKISWADVFQFTHQPDAARRESLGIGRSEFRILTTGSDDSSHHRFGSPALDRYDVVDFLRSAKVTRKELQELLETSYVNPSQHIRIVTDRTDVNQYQEFFEEADTTLTDGNISEDFLRRMHRFINLWKKLPWRIAELDLVLKKLPRAGTEDRINANAIYRVADLLQLQKRFGWTVEQLAALFAPMDGAEDRHVTLKERLFLRPEIPEDNNKARLIAGTGLAEAELVILAIGLISVKPSIARNWTTEPWNDENDWDEFSKDDFDWFYRRALLCQGLKVSAATLLYAEQFGSSADTPPLEDIKRLLEVIRFIDWLKASPWTTDQLTRLLDEGAPMLNPRRFKDDDADKIFTAIQSWSSATPATEYLKALNASGPEFSGLSKDAKAVLYSYCWTATDISTIRSAATTDQITTAKTTIKNNFHQMELYHDVFQAYRWRDDLILFFLMLIQETPEADFRKLKFAYLEWMEILDKFIRAFPEAQLIVPPASATTDPLQAKLGDILKGLPLDPGYVDSIMAFVQPNSPSDLADLFGDLDRLRMALLYFETTGLNGASLQLIAPMENAANYNTRLNKGQETLIAAILNKYPDEKQRNEVVEKFEKRLREIKRDALIDFLISDQRHRIKDEHDLYNYYLMDPLMEGCAQTTWVLAAISSLQVYVQRCLLGLEIGDNRTPDNADDDFPMEPDDEAREEWEWRKNYRVWEAARKVYLYPENYIEPELRDDKTPFFKELEDEIMQQEISLESAEEAYRVYLEKFREVAELQIAGSYYDGSSKKLFLIGRTTGETPVFYYRVSDGNKGSIFAGRKSWEPWQKIEVAIGAKQVSPIVYKNQLYLFWVEIVTNSKTEFKGGNSEFVGYDHKITVKYSRQNTVGKWLSPIAMVLEKQLFELRTEKNSNTIVKEGEKSYEPISGHTLSEYHWSRIYTSISDSDEIEFYFGEHSKPLGYDNGLLSIVDSGDTSISIANGVIKGSLQYQNIGVPFILNLQEAKLIPDSTIGIWNNISSSHDKSNSYNAHYINSGISSAIKSADFSSYEACEYFVRTKAAEGWTYDNPNEILIGNVNISEIKPKLLPVNGYSLVPVSILEVGSDVLLLTSNFLINRLGTTAFQGLIENYYQFGLQVLLSTQLQQEIDEDEIPFKFTPEGSLQVVRHSKFDGTYGAYYWELYFHIPFLLANHLNATQKFDAARHWYHCILNPTPPEESGMHMNDRVWQFIEFRNIGAMKLEDALRDDRAIEAWEGAPFNPHQVARKRPWAYKKTVFMKYVDNLLDWGDHLFAQDTYESINEATMLYILAFELMGERPYELGDCEVVDATQRTYDVIGPAIDAAENSDFLIELENLTFQLDPSVSTMDLRLGEAHMSGGRPLGDILSVDSLRGGGLLEQINGTPMKGPTIANPGPVRTRRQPLSIIPNITPVFCIPHNAEFLRYWDLVEDRLFKIRNCMNIKGIRRELPFFQPPLDVMNLVKGSALGLSLDEILQSMQAELPIYRFTFLLEKAKQFVQTVQSFGGALLSAIEKKDAEELGHLRMVHEQNILNLTRRIKQDQIKEAGEQYLAMEFSEQSAQNRFDHYQGLIEEGLIVLENLEQGFRHTANALRIVEGGILTYAAISYLIPEIGSPFAMKYGGVQAGDSASALAAFFKGAGQILDGFAGSFSIGAGNQRREQEWKFQRQQAETDLKQVQRQKEAARLRHLIAERDLEIHEKNIAQTKEQFDFIKNKKSNLALYNFLSVTLNRMYREAYQLALGVARQAEKAMQFELNDESSYLEMDNWDGANSGLLAGEKLMLQLMQMENAYLTTNRREFEITKHISLNQLDPLELMNLRASGTCTFEVPEELFDLDFPGHYLRRIKSVSLSIPCVAGPYTTVNATLRLDEHQVRQRDNSTYPMVGWNPITGQNVAISSAQNDSGLFELNFRDERYLPFEGKGAVSKWSLELMEEPKLRQFDYDTISDVILHIRYTSQEDQSATESLKSSALHRLTAAIDSLSDTPLVRLFSLRHDFPNEYHKWKQGDKLSIEIRTDRHFPYWVQGRRPSLSQVKIHSARNLEGQQLSAPSGDGPWNIVIRSEDVANVIDPSTLTAKDLYLSVGYQVSNV